MADGLPKSGDPEQSGNLSDADKRDKQNSKPGLAQRRRQEGSSALDRLDQFNETRRPDSKVVELENHLQELKRNYQAMMALHRVTAKINSTLELDEVLSAIVDNVVALAACDRGFLMLNEGNTGTVSDLQLRISRSTEESPWDPEDERFSNSVVAAVYMSRRPLVNTNLGDDEGLKDTDSIHVLSINTAVCLPLVYDNELLGVIYADSKQFSDRIFGTEEILMKFSEQAALALHNAKQHGELRVLQRDLESQNSALRHQLAGEYEAYGMLSRNPKMHEIFEFTQTFARHNVPVVVHGESGTGKELLARAIHGQSKRSAGPFEAVNCSTIQSLVEDELFGHSKGAFTGADSDRAGYFEIAHGGTLFLDEIGEMPLAVQAKILRVVENGEVRRLGEERVRQVDVRLVCATHVDLERAVVEGKFRKDLLNRLRGAVVVLPPLRERRDDIVPLAERFLARQATSEGVEAPRLSRAAKEYLVSLDYRDGNVRQLRAAVGFGFMFAENGVIQVEPLKRFSEPHGGQGSDDQKPVKGSLKECMQAYERELITDRLGAFSNNVTQTAKDLDISRQQLHNKINKFNIVLK